MVEELRKRGGDITPDEDVPVLAQAGVARVFRPGASTQGIVDWIRTHVPRRAA